MMYESPISQSLLAKLLDTQETDYLCSNAYKISFCTISYTQVAIPFFVLTAIGWLLVVIGFGLGTGRGYVVTFIIFIEVALVAHTTYKSVRTELSF